MAKLDTESTMQSQITKIIEKIDRQTGLLYLLTQACEDHFRDGTPMNKQQVAGAHSLLEIMAGDWAKIRDDVGKLGEK